MSAWLRTHRLEGAATILWLLVALVGALMTVRATGIGYVPATGEIAGPILALEFADRPDRVTAVVLAGGADRRGPIRQVQQLDAFFIPLYVALLGVTTGIAARNRRRAGRMVAGVAVALFVSAGVFDHRENGAIESLLASLDWAVGSAPPVRIGRRRGAAGAAGVRPAGTRGA